MISIPTSDSFDENRTCSCSKTRDSIRLLSILHSDFFFFFFFVSHRHLLDVVVVVETLETLLSLILILSSMEKKKEERRKQDRRQMTTMIPSSMMACLIFVFLKISRYSYRSLLDSHLFSILSLVFSSHCAHSDFPYSSESTSRRYA